MARVVDLAQAFFRALKPWHGGLACGALLFFAVVLLVAGFSLLQDTQEVSG
jgi:hypothetical protein